MGVNDRIQSAVFPFLPDLDRIGIGFGSTMSETQKEKASFFLPTYPCSIPSPFFSSLLPRSCSLVPSFSALEFGGQSCGGWDCFAMVFFCTYDMVCKQEKFPFVSIGTVLCFFVAGFAFLFVPCCGNLGVFARRVGNGSSLLGLVRACFVSYSLS